MSRALIIGAVMGMWAALGFALGVLPMETPGQVIGLVAGHAAAAVAISEMSR